MVMSTVGTTTPLTTKPWTAAANMIHLSKFYHPINKRLLSKKFIMSSKPAKRGGNKILALEPESIMQHTCEPVPNMQTR